MPFMSLSLLTGITRIEPERVTAEVELPMLFIKMLAWKKETLP